jgi:hypothetical protein
MRLSGSLPSLPESFIELLGVALRVRRQMLQNM